MARGNLAVLGPWVGNGGRTIILDSLEVVVSRDFLVGSRGLSNFYVGGSDFMLV